MRIIAGTARGMTLFSPKGLATRPTADRIKESLFSVLTARNLIHGRRVLDIFSGTGALALESLSRGAAFSVAIDCKTAAIIKANAQKAHLLDKITVYGLKWQAALAKIAAQNTPEQNGSLTGKFDLVFSDPPYGKGLTEEVLLSLGEHGLLSPDGIVAAEAGRDECLTIPPTFAIERELSYGKTTKILLLRKRNED